MVRIDYYLSRVTHILTGGLLIGVSLVPLISSGELLLPNWATPAAAGLALFTGLYNAGAARPSRMGAKAKTYRMMIYGGKTLLLVGMTPALNKIIDDAQVPAVRLGLACAAVLVGSFARYFREETLGMNEEPAKKK